MSGVERAGETFTRWQRIRRFALARFDRGSELGLGLTFSLLVLAGGVYAFSGLLEDVLEAESLVRWDIATNDWFYRHQSANVLHFFHTITQLGSPGVWVIAVLVAAWLVSRNDYMLLWAWVAANAGGLALQLVLKASVHRSRPPYAATHLHGTTYSFPSGHTMSATIGFFMLVYVLATTHGWRGSRRVAAYGAAVIAALLVALSRLVLAVHFPSDVIAGLAAAAAWLAACFSVLHVLRWRADLNRTTIRGTES